MSFPKITNQPTETTVNSVDSTSKTSASEQLSSTAKVFCEACNQIVKAYLANYHENNRYQTINLSFAQKVIKKTKISFSQLVVTLVYLNRYYQSCTTFKKHLPGHKESVIPSLSHVVLLCIIQAERYVTDIPHKLSWWASVCAGQTRSFDINKWQREFFNTINYHLYVHPEKDYNVFKMEVKRLASRLFQNSVKMPPQFRRSIHLGSQGTPTPTTTSSQPRIPSQPNIVSTSASNSLVQPQLLLSPLYSGHSNGPLVATSAQTTLLSSSQMLTSPMASNDGSHPGITVVPTTQTAEVPILNITNTNLTTSPVGYGIESTMINQTRSPNSLYSNGTHIASPLPPIQNPNNLMVQPTNSLYSPVRPSTSTSSNTSLIDLTTQSDDMTNLTNTTHLTTTHITQSPIQSPTKMTHTEPVIIIEEEETEIKRTLPPRPVKRKRSYYEPYQASVHTSEFLKMAQNYKKSKISMTISPEELDFQPNTPNSRPVEENNKKENSSLYQTQSARLIISPNQNGASSSNFRGDQVSSLNKGKNEAVTTSESSTYSFRNSEESLNSIVETSFHPIETIPNSTFDHTSKDPLNVNETVHSEEIIVSSLLLTANNSTSLTLIPVSPPLTPN